MGVAYDEDDLDRLVAVTDGYLYFFAAMGRRNLEHCSKLAHHAG